MIYLAIDNGVSGSIGWVNDICSKSGAVTMPIFSEQDYVRKKQNVTRIDVKELNLLLRRAEDDARAGKMEGGLTVIYNECIRIILERPFVNPMMFRATLSAIRAWEAVLIVLKDFAWPRIVVDSKAWQKAMLPEGVKGGPELKKASRSIGMRLFPDHSDWIKDHGDADSLLIAEYARRNKL